ncbi:hypothetical protein [Actinocrispum wychmicini]|uniref:hypothetical protein n=1 Tax=Actinocrispum wychmicini TaxID=1213861 RepID=UPI00104F6D6A|nr:hypothetical protein [Actinocrispum wychmicini]
MTGESHEWVVVDEGRSIPWTSYAGPLRLSQADFAGACRTLLAIEPADVPDVALDHAEIGSADGPERRIILHSTTPTTRGFETDLAAMAEGRVPVDITTYTETRALYLARPGDLAVGRLRPWRLAPTAPGVERLALDDTDHYYMSHALLHRAVNRGERDPVLARLIAWLRERRATVLSVYDFEPELQLLVAWLARRAGVHRVRVDANDPRLVAWNRKGTLHPTVEAALAVDVDPTADPTRALDLERRASDAFRILGEPLAVLPGYTVTRHSGRDAFHQDFLRAGKLLSERYGLTQACLKPSEGGDGGRIVVGIDLADHARLAELASRAWTSGGDQVIEAHVTYLQRDVNGERIPVAPSTHLRDGSVLDGLTLQFMRGPSWKGNIYVDRPGWQALGLGRAAYDEIRAEMAALTGRLRHHGLVQAGIDFAVGTLGGRFEDTVVVAIQDINAKLTGAVLLREFMARHPIDTSAGAATRVFRPAASATPSAVQHHLSTKPAGGTRRELIATVPGRWGMLAVTGATPLEAGALALTAEQDLIAEGLAADGWPTR